MKKRKYLLLTFLALAIVTSLTAGTLAIYTSTQNLESTDVQAKQFVFESARTADYKQSVKMAPTEKQDYPFTVTNDNKGTIAEVPMYYEITADVDGIISTLPGLNVKLIRLDGTTETVVRESTSADITWGGDAETTTHFAANTSATHNYILRLEWVSSGANNAAQTEVGKNADADDFGITVTATQDVTPQTSPAVVPAA